MRISLLFFLVLVFNATVLAQYSETISSDRPGMSYSANTVGARVLQFQVGGDFGQVAFNRGFGSGYIGGSFDGVIRVGIIERLEMDFSVNYLKMDNEITDFQTPPMENFEWGFKLRGNVLNSNGKRPSIGLLAEIFFPSVTTTYFHYGIYQRFSVLLEQPLEKRIRLASNIAMVSGGRSPTFQYTLNLSVDVSPIATVFIEHFGQYYARYGSSTRKVDFYYPRVIGGFSIRPLSDFQIDVQASYGSWVVAPDPQKDWYVGLGFSWRLRFKKKEA
ncbi:MAG: hypothetical protein H6601_02405 [Flavobacteriales bacterium]|nr:hypothetical protein [Flavobacteriales bacterium]